MTDVKAATDQAIGAAAAAVGAGGLSMQWLTDAANLGLVALNILLAICGLALVRQRRRIARMEEDALERSRDDDEGSGF